jgi:uncharacterized protein
MISLSISLPWPARTACTDECGPLPQTREQRKVRAILLELGDRLAKRHGLTRDAFFKTPSGLATAFHAMNLVYGDHFGFNPAEDLDPAGSRQRAESLSDQFIFDDQLHYVHDGYSRKDILFLRGFARLRLNPALKGEKTRKDKVQLVNFFKEVFLESDTKVGLLSGATADQPQNWFLPNEEIASGRDVINAALGSKGMLCHSLFAPGHPGYLEEIDKAVEVYRPDSWKGYTTGDPFHYSRFPWRLDDEKLAYPAYEKFLKAGIRNVCIHKGLLPAKFLKKIANWRYDGIEDLPRAAKDWPELNFIIYHAAFQPSLRIPKKYLTRFERDGRMDWVTDLAAIPAEHQVSNVYAEIGSTFALTAVLHPRLAAAVLGILIKGLGEDHVLWGTDSVFYGSPQWQIEALRRIEIPDDMQEAKGFGPLGGPDSGIKKKIFGGNGARLYGLDPDSAEYRQNDILMSLKQTAVSSPDRIDGLLADLLRIN